MLPQLQRLPIAPLPLFGALLAASCSSPGSATADAPEDTAPPRLPNIVVVYADDLGIGDLSCYNAEAAYETPRLDRMAAEGMLFTDAHSPSTICSPSRYGLIAGQIVARTGRGTRAFEGPGGPSYVVPEDLTVAEALKAAGYRTGIFGKWHLGLTWFDAEGKRLGGGFDNSLKIDYEKSCPLVDGPQTMGFDESFVTPNCPTTDPLYLYIENGMVPVPASMRHKRDTLPNPGGKWRWDNDEGWKAEGYRFVDADLLFLDKATAFVREHREQHAEDPFFMILSTQICHAPVLPAPGFEGATEAGARGDFVRELDTLTGRLLDTLDELGIGDDTLVIFHADNGPETLHTIWMREDHDHDAAGGRRGMKRDGWEGGHRVPLIARWPGRVPAGSVTGQLACTTDLVATFASIAGQDVPDEVAVDSFDLLPALVGAKGDDDPVRPHLVTQSFRGEYQLRVGDWKYLAHQGSGGNNYSRGKMANYVIDDGSGDAPAQLYDLASDPGETRNLYATEPERRERMETLLEELSGKEGRSAPTGRRARGMEYVRARSRN